MLTKSIGFIGAGRIVRVLLAGWQQAGVKLPTVVAADSDPAALERLAHSGDCLLTCDATQAAAQDVIFIALHPPCISQGLGELQTAIRDTAIVISLAPKFTIKQLSAQLGGFDRIARVIPNAPSLVGSGYNPVAYGPALLGEDRTAIAELFKPLGAFPEVPEDLLEVYAVITAMGPTYLWPQLEELQSFAESFGLAPDQALAAVAHMAMGSAASLTQSNLTAAELLNLIPVQPLGDSESTIREVYRTKLPGLLEKIRPATN